MPEHLLNIKQVAEYLGVSEEEVKRLVDIGEIPAYQIGDSFLRFRKEQIDAVKQEISDVEKKDPNRVEVKLDSSGKPTHTYTDLEKSMKIKTPVARQYDYTFSERIQDTIYYNDFYILAGIIIAVLLFIILRS
jgi:excisionase family DNA binding protein